jgi:hypothetical protein
MTAKVTHMHDKGCQREGEGGRGGARGGGEGGRGEGKFRPEPEFVNV